MNLSLLKSAAELAKTSPLELEIWQMEISPDDVLRLVAGMEALEECRTLMGPNVPSCCGCEYEWSHALEAINKALKGIEP